MGPLSRQLAGNIRTFDTQSGNLGRDPTRNRDISLQAPMHTTLPAATEFLREQLATTLMNMKPRDGMTADPEQIWCLAEELLYFPAAYLE